MTIDRADIARAIKTDPADPAFKALYALIQERHQYATSHQRDTFTVSRGGVEEVFRITDFTQRLARRAWITPQKMLLDLSDTSDAVLLKIRKLHLARASFTSSRSFDRTVKFFAPLTPISEKQGMMCVADICARYNLEKTAVNNALFPYRLAWEQYWYYRDQFERSTKGKMPDTGFVNNGITTDIHQFGYFLVEDTKREIPDKVFHIHTELAARIFRKVEKTRSLQLNTVASNGNFIDGDKLIKSHLPGVGRAIFSYYWGDVLKPYLVDRRLRELSGKEITNYVFVIEEVVPASLFHLGKDQKHLIVLYTDSSRLNELLRIPSIAAKHEPSCKEWKTQEDIATLFSQRLAHIDSSRSITPKRTMLLLREIRECKQRWANHLKELNEQGVDVHIGSVSRPIMSWKGIRINETMVANVIANGGLISLQVHKSYVEDLIDPSEICTKSRDPEGRNSDLTSAQRKQKLDWFEMKDVAQSALLGKFENVSPAIITNAVIAVYTSVAKQTNNAPEVNFVNDHGKLLISKKDSSVVITAVEAILQKRGYVARQTEHDAHEKKHAPKARRQHFSAAHHAHN